MVMNALITKRRKFSCCLFTILVLNLFSISFVCLEAGVCSDSTDGSNSSGSSASVFDMVINRPESSPLYRWTESIYTEVFRRIDMKIRFHYYPLKRASVQVNRGEADGEPARIYSYAETYTNLVRVDEVVFSMVVAAYASDPSIKGLDGWQSLRNSDFLVEYPRGMKLCELNLAKVVRPDLLRAINESYQGLARLAKKRIDIYVEDVNSTSPLIENPDFQFKSQVHVAGVMQETPLYMYVHKKYSAIVPELAGTIRSMKSEGLIDTYRQEVFNIKN